MTEILLSVSPLVFNWSMLGRGSSSAAFLLPCPEKGIVWPIPCWTHLAWVAVGHLRQHSATVPWEVMPMPIASRCAWVITIQNLYPAWVILMTTHFLYPKIGVSAWIFWNFSSQVKIRYLRHSFLKFLLIIFLLVIMLHWPQKVVILWFITLQSLNQFQNNLTFLNQHEKYELLILNLRKIWDGGLTGWDSWHGMTS